MKKYILVAVSAKSDADPRREAQVCNNYVSWIQRGCPGFEVVPVEHIDRAFVQSHRAEVAGLVLSGGCDVDPVLYGQKPHPKTQTPDHDRDRFEQWLFTVAQEHRWPLLGICRGLQIVNVLLGGSLIQDIGMTHAQEEKYVDKHHQITVLPGTVLHRLVGTDETSVNSSHHQVVDPAHLGTHLRISATSQANGVDIVEALETTDSLWPWLLLVQWHPERIPASTSSRAIIEDFAIHLL